MQVSTIVQSKVKIKYYPSHGNGYEIVYKKGLYIYDVITYDRC